MRALLVAAFVLLSSPAFAAAGDPIAKVAIIIRESPGGAVAADGMTDADGKAVFRLPVHGYRITFLLPPEKAAQGAMDDSAELFLASDGVRSSYHTVRATSPRLNVTMDVNELEVEVLSASGVLSADLVLAFDETVAIRVIEGPQR